MGAFLLFPLTTGHQRNAYIHVEVEVSVYAENAQGNVRLTNKARCWYVGTPLPVPGTQVGISNRDRMRAFLLSPFVGHR